MSAESVFQSFEQDGTQHYSPARLELTLVPPLPDDDITIELFGGSTKIPLEHVEEWRLVQKELQEATLARDAAENSYAAAVMARIAIANQPEALAAYEPEYNATLESVNIANIRFNAAIIARLGLAGLIRDRLSKQS